MDVDIYPNTRESVDLLLRTVSFGCAGGRCSYILLYNIWGQRPDRKIKRKKKLASFPYFILDFYWVQKHL